MRAPTKRKFFTGSLARGTGATLSFVLSVLPLILLVGAWLPQLPVIGALGSIAVSLWPAWLALLALLGAAIGRVSLSGPFRHVPLGMAALVTFGSADAIFRLLSVAQANGVAVAPLAPFGSGGGRATNPADKVTAYTRDLGEALTIRFWRPAGNPPPGGWPIFVYVHGGGWISESNRQRSSDMRWFADQGLLVASVEYSLSGEHRHLWDRTIAQVGCALSWLRVNAAARGGKTEDIVLFGDSAGGNLVINAAYLASAGKLPSTCGGSPPRIRAVSATYPVVDPQAMYRGSYSLTGRAARDMVRKYVGGSPERFPARYRAISSSSAIHPGAPPTLIFIGENDHLVPPESMHSFVTEAQAAGIEVEKVSVPFGEHVFDAAGIGNAIVRQKTYRFIMTHMR